MIKIFFKPYSALIFINNYKIGAILLALTFIKPSVAVGGLIALIATFGFTELIGLREEFLEKGFYLYNSLLVGMGVGYIFEPTLYSTILIIILASFTFLFSFMLNRLFLPYKIPILSLPFAIVTILAYLASIKYSELLTTILNHSPLIDIKVPLILSGYFKSLGAIFFLPYNLAGLIIALILLYSSRILFLLSLISFYLGVYVHSILLGSFQEALLYPYSFNYILVGMALGGIFLLPTLRNYFLALIGVMISVILNDAIEILLNYFSVPVFTLPFNITAITFIFVLYLIGYREFNYNIKSSPEESLSSYLSSIYRFKSNLIKISLPFSGKWSVYQAFDGEWTHKGKFKYAYDFVIKKDGKCYKGDGEYLTDYYAFGESILSPIEGYVVAAIDHLPDNQIGVVDRINNWGNYIIIQSLNGFFVQISHLMQYSLKVKVGEYVSFKQIIAKCGNSGYSPIPHIHIQVQELGIVGAFTKKFIFSEYLKEKELIFNSNTKKDEEIESVIIDNTLKAKFTWILDEKYEYDLIKDNKIVDTIKYEVKMSPAGEFYLEDSKGNRAFFYTSSESFYFYHYEGKESLLKEIFKVAPRVPFVNKEVFFYDYLPIAVLFGSFKSKIVELLASFAPNMAKFKFKYQFNNLVIKSNFGSAKISYDLKGFEEITINRYKLIRKRS